MTQSPDQPTPAPLPTKCADCGAEIVLDKRGVMGGGWFHNYPKSNSDDHPARPAAVEPAPPVERCETCGTPIKFLNEGGVAWVHSGPDWFKRQGDHKPTPSPSPSSAEVEAAVRRIMAAVYDGDEGMNWDDREYQRAARIERAIRKECDHGK